MKLRSLSRHWAARGGVAAVTAVTVVTLAAGMQAGAAAAVHRGAAVSPADPYSPAYHHAYRHGFVPTRGTALTMHRWGLAHPAAAQAAAAGNLMSYGGGIGNIGVTTGPEQVYLVFWGSQWGTQGSSNGDVTLAGDPSQEAPYLQELFKGLGTNGERWSGVMTQYCDWVATGATSCPASNPLHVAYPTGGSTLAGVWADESTAAPSQATGHQLGAEAVKAAGHFGNTTAASNRDAQYVVLSPTGTHPDGFNTTAGQFCAWHDSNGDATLSGGPVTSPYGGIAFTNFPYVTDLGKSCGQNFVNSGSGGKLDGVSIVEGHEYAETITDQNPPGGWTDATGEENGDKCAWITPGTSGGSFDLTLATGTFAMQTTWANDGASGAGACEASHAIVPDGSAHLIRVASPGTRRGRVGTAVSLQISALDSASGETLSYRATGLPPGLSIGAGSGLITGTPTAGGIYHVTVTAADSTLATGSATFIWAVATQLLKNPGFESGVISPWTSTSGVLLKSSTLAHSGVWLARLDGRGGKHTDTLAQKVTISRYWASAGFSFWLKVKSNDPTTKAYDTLKVEVLSSSGTVLKTLATYSNKSIRNTYLKHSFSLNSYLGRTIILKFIGTETLARHNTSFQVDDNALNAS